MSSGDFHAAPALHASCSDSAAYIVPTTSPTVHPTPAPTPWFLSCPAGKFGLRSNDSSHCHRCAAGTFSATRAAATCRACVAGKFQPARGGTSCSACAIGRSSEAAAEAAAAPAAGPGAGPSLYALGPSGCVDCPAGKFGLPAHSHSQGSGGTGAGGGGSGGAGNSGGGTLCTACPAGKVQRLAGQGWCPDCPAGWFAPRRQAGGLHCRRCPAGSASADVAAAQCHACDNGRFQSQQAALSCRACPKGKYTRSAAASVAAALRDHLPSAGQRRCTLCVAGAFAADSQATACHTCPAGKYNGNPGDAACKKCPNDPDQLGVLQVGARRHSITATRQSTLRLAFLTATLLC